MITYLASPYSHPLASVREARFRLVCHAAAYLIQTGYVIFSPIAHTHHIAMHDLPKDFDYWSKIDMEFLAVCGSMIVLMLDGWEKSVGVKAETHIMREARKPVSYLAWPLDRHDLK